MSEVKKSENTFKFGLYLRGEKLFERIFSADKYNPVVRYSVDIRSRIPAIIESIQNVLQSDANELTAHEYNGENTKDYYLKVCKNDKLAPIKLFVPRPKPQTDPVKTKFQGKGTEFKFGVYINTNPIVERNFYVDNYNPDSRFSLELPQVLEDIVDDLVTYLKTSDVNHMWNDFDLITTYELNIQQVRELSKEKREEFLARKNDLAFIEKVRSDYHKNSEYSA